VLHDTAPPTRPSLLSNVDLWRVGVHDQGLNAALARVRLFGPDICFSTTCARSTWRRGCSANGRSSR
jgi:hypothetical protein